MLTLLMTINYSIRFIRHDHAYEVFFIFTVLLCNKYNITVP